MCKQISYMKYLRVGGSPQHGGIGNGEIKPTYVTSVTIIGISMYFTHVYTFVRLVLIFNDDEPVKPRRDEAGPMQDSEKESPRAV